MTKGSFEARLAMPKIYQRECCHIVWEFCLGTATVLSRPVGDPSGYGFPTLIHVWIVSALLLVLVNHSNMPAGTIQT